MCLSFNDFWTVQRQADHYFTRWQPFGNQRFPEHVKNETPVKNSEELGIVKFECLQVTLRRGKWLVGGSPGLSTLWMETLFLITETGNTPVDV